MSFGPAKAALHILAATRPQRFATRVNVRVREQLAEFMGFLERELGSILGDERGEAVFVELQGRWSNRQPVELEHPPGGSGGSDDHEAPPGGPGGPTLQ